MRSFFHSVFVFLLAAVVVCLHDDDAGAHFERSFTSARCVSLGGAFVGTADDPSAAALNPAGLARTTKLSFLTTYQNPYGLDDVDEGSAAAAVPFGWGVLGVTWHHLGMRDVMSEDVLRLAFGRDLVHNTQDASLSVGASVGVARVSVSEPNQSKNVFTGSLGVLLRPFPAIGIGYAVGNLIEGSFDLIQGGGKTDLERTQAWGVSIQWHKRVTLSLEKKKAVYGEWTDHAGLEVTLAPGVVLRSGLDGRYAVAGVGFTRAGISVDLGTTSHEYLGSTYVVSLGYSYAKKKAADEQTQ